MPRPTRWAVALIGAAATGVGVGAAVAGVAQAPSATEELVAVSSHELTEEAPEPAPHDPFADQDPLTHVTFTDNGDGTGTLTYTLGGEQQTITITEEPDSVNGELTQGDIVRSFAEAVEEHPGRGCLVAEVATADFGLRGDVEPPPTDGTGCPDGVHAWLQTFAGQGADEGGTREGPPAFVEPGGSGREDESSSDPGPPGDLGPPPEAGPPSDAGRPNDAGPPADAGPPGRP